MNNSVFGSAGELIADDAKEFILTYFDSFVTWDLLAFLSENPEFMGNILDLAAVLGRDESDVERAVNTNVERGFLILEQKAGEPFYWYTHDLEMRHRVAKAVEVAKDYNVRLCIINHILRQQNS